VLTEECFSFPQSTSEGRLVSSFGSLEPLFQNFALSHERDAAEALPLPARYYCPHGLRSPDGD